MVTTRRQAQKSGRTLRSGVKSVNPFNNTPKRKSRRSFVKSSTSNKHKVARNTSSTKENTNERAEPEAISNELSIEMEVRNELHGSQPTDVPDTEEGSFANLETLTDGNGPQPQTSPSNAAAADGDTVDDTISETPTIPGFKIPLKFANGSMEWIEILPQLTENEWPFGPPVEERKCDTHGTELLCPIPDGHWTFPYQFEDSVELELKRMLESEISIDEPADCQTPLHQHIRCVERKGTNEDLGDCYFVRWRDSWFPKSEIDGV